MVLLLVFGAFFVWFVYMMLNPGPTSQECLDRGLIPGQGQCGGPLPSYSWQTP